MRPHTLAQMARFCQDRIASQSWAARGTWFALRVRQPIQDEAGRMLRKLKPCVKRVEGWYSGPSSSSPRQWTRYFVEKALSFNSFVSDRLGLFDGRQATGISSRLLNRCFQQRQRS
jgi:hypothetical protein